MAYDKKVIKGVLNMTLDDQKILASQFAEGSPILEELLRKCWSLGLETNSCCKGHDKNQLPFINFRYKDDIFDYLNNMLFAIEEMEDLHYEIDFISSYDDFLISFSCSLNDSNRFFDCLNKFIQVRNKDVHPTLMLALQIDKIMASYGLNIRLAYNDNEMCLGLTKAGQTVVFNQISRDLKENIEMLKEKQQFTDGSFNCDLDSLSEFIDILGGSQSKNK